VAIVKHLSQSHEMPQRPALSRLFTHTCTDSDMGKEFLWRMVGERYPSAEPLSIDIRPIPGVKSLVQVPDECSLLPGVKQKGLSSRIRQQGICMDVTMEGHYSHRILPQSWNDITDDMSKTYTGIRVTVHRALINGLLWTIYLVKLAIDP
jgi:hypothetical protein